jgi:hypothetical protein
MQKFTKSLTLAIIAISLFFIIINNFVVIPRSPLIFIEQTYTNDIAWNPDGERIAINNTIYNINDPLNDREYISISNVRRLSWSLDGSMLGLVGDQVWLWTGGKLFTLVEAIPYRVYSDVTFDLDNNILIAVSYGLSDADNFVWLWNISNHELLGKIKGDNSLTTSNPTGDRGFLTIQALSETSMVVTSSWENNVNRLWDITQLKSALLPKVDLSRYGVITVSPSGNLLAMADDHNNLIDILSMETSSILVLKSELDGIDILEWNRSNNLLLGASIDASKMTVWDVTTGQIISSRNTSSTNQLDFDWHPTNDLLAIATDKEVLVWNPLTDITWLVYTGYANKVRWSFDGEKIAIVSRDGVYIYQWISQS